MRGLMRGLDRLLAGLFCLLIRVYQLTLSPLLRLLGAGCRFHPSCSRYAMECFRVHAVPRAFWLSVRRILRCHPWHPGGFDPVPPKKNKIGDNNH